MHVYGQRQGIEDNLQSQVQNFLATECFNLQFQYTLICFLWYFDTTQAVGVYILYNFQGRIAVFRQSLKNNKKYQEIAISNPNKFCDQETSKYCL